MTEDVKNVLEVEAVVFLEKGTDDESVISHHRDLAKRSSMFMEQDSAGGSGSEGLHEDIVFDADEADRYCSDIVSEVDLKEGEDIDIKQERSEFVLDTLEVDNEEPRKNELQSESRLRPRKLSAKTKAQPQGLKRKEPNKKSSQKFGRRSGRKKFKCPVKGCVKSYVSLPVHLRGKHQWSWAEARYATVNYELQEKRQYIEKPKGKDYHRKRQCPVEGCPAHVKRLQLHLQRRHKMGPLPRDGAARPATSKGNLGTVSSPRDRSLNSNSPSSPRGRSLNSNSPPDESMSMIEFTLLIVKFRQFCASCSVKTGSREVFVQYVLHITEIFKSVQIFGDMFRYKTLIAVLAVFRRDKKLVTSDLRSYISSVREFLNFLHKEQEALLQQFRIDYHEVLKELQILSDCLSLALEPENQKIESTRSLKRTIATQFNPDDCPKDVDEPEKQETEATRVLIKSIATQCNLEDCPKDADEPENQKTEPSKGLMKTLSTKYNIDDYQAGVDDKDPIGKKEVASGVHGASFEDSSALTSSQGKRSHVNNAWLARHEETLFLSCREYLLEQRVEQQGVVRRLARTRDGNELLRLYAYPKIKSKLNYFKALRHPKYSEWFSERMRSVKKR